MTDASVRARRDGVLPDPARRPEATRGGWPIKTLKPLADLWVFVAPCANPGAAEAAMLGAFAHAFR